MPHRTAHARTRTWSQLLIVATLLHTARREALASTCPMNIGWTAKMNTKPAVERMRTTVSLAPQAVGGHSMIQKTGQVDPRQVPEGFVLGYWDMPAMCAVLFDKLKNDPASLCNAKLATGLDPTHTARNRARYGETATVDCTGTTPPFVALSLCSSTCMLDTSQTCCKVPAQYAGFFPCCRDECCCVDQLDDATCKPKSAVQGGAKCHDGAGCPKRVRDTAAMYGPRNSYVAWKCATDAATKTQCPLSCGTCSGAAAGPTCADAPSSGLLDGSSSRRMACAEAVKRFTCAHPEHGAALRWACPAACGTCGACLDGDHSGNADQSGKPISCADYKRRLGGRCDTAMRFYCPRSCGACSVPPGGYAFDKCADWKDSGFKKSKATKKTYTCAQVASHCSNPKFSAKLAKYCPKTCGKCPVAGAGGWTEASNKFCARSGSPLPSASAAEAACASSSSCPAIYDQKCDGAGDFYMCKANSVRASSQGSCVHLKPAGSGCSDSVGDAAFKTQGITCAQLKAAAQCKLITGSAKFKAAGVDTMCSCSCPTATGRRRRAQPQLHRPHHAQATVGLSISVTIEENVAATSIYDRLLACLLTATSPDACTRTITAGGH